MIVPAKRKFICRERYKSIKVGETFSIDSGMGGSHTVTLVGWDAARDWATFRVENPQSTFHGLEFRFPCSELHHKLYILVPDNPNFA